MAFEDLAQDVRYGARQLVKAPLFTIVSTLSLGIGIAVTVTIFSIVNYIVFKPLPVERPDDIVQVFTSAGTGPDEYQFTGSAYSDLRDYQASGAFKDVAAYRSTWVRIAANELPPAREDAEFVSPNYFNVLNLPLSSGRYFTADGRQPEIIISELYRRRVFGSSRNVIGKTVRVDGSEFTIIGVAPSSFRGLDVFSSVTAWLPAPAAVRDRNSLTNREMRYWGIVARLAPGRPPEAVNGRLASMARGLAQQYPKSWTHNGNVTRRITVIRPRELLMRAAGGDFALMLGTLSAVVGIILVLACTNVAGLLLTRAVTRRHEFTVRMTIGAGRPRLIRQLLTESFILAMMGGAAGLLMAELTMRLAATSSMFASFDLSPDWRVFAATLSASAVCALIFGVTPALHTLRIDLKSGLSGHSVLGEKGGVRSRLMALQVSLSFLLIVLGFSATRGIQSQLHASPGFNIDGMLAGYLDYPPGDSAVRDEYFRTALEITRGVEGVQHAIISERIPLTGYPTSDVSVATPGGAMASGYEKVDAEYFATIAMPLVRGRLPRSTEFRNDASTRRVAVVDRTLIRKIGHDIVGGTIRIDNNHDVLVVGVVESIRHTPIESPDRPYIYELSSGVQRPGRAQYILARVKPGSEASVAQEITRRLRDRYPKHVPVSMNTLRATLEGNLAPQRFFGRIVFGIGAIELALAAIGLYSILLYATLTRTREIGLRMALGAASGRASFTVMKEGLMFVLAGAVLGLGLGVPATIFGSRNFSGGDATDPVPFIAAIVAISVATALATLVPAHKASRVQPMEALRHE